ncbi:hypothetical protein [Streptomyces sp. GbtcB6]|uniref:hypothetical protein n=1 Tax=Streptomyces sp. GbtcB6 TaxID=2824751 RepID=UPI001C2FB5D3|nr:hypothetical protein [Streptomyces sp. GbtcB6]
MGIYLVSVGAQEWLEGDEGDEDEGGKGTLAAALDEELRRRGLAPYESVPEAAAFVRGSGLSFEEKLVPPMDGFGALCREHLSPQEGDFLLGWSVLVPFSLDEEIRLPLPSAYTDETVVAGAPEVLALAQRLAAAIGLPVHRIPEACDNLDLTMWFLDGPAKDVAAAHPGPWGEDLDAAFYVALYLRAAQHSLRRGCPMTYC